MKIKNKKAVAVGTVVTLGLTLVAIVMLFLIFKPIMELIHTIGEDYFRCFLTKFIAAFGTLGFGSGGFCEPIVKTISIDKIGDDYITLNKELTKNEKEHVKKWYTNYDTDDKNWLYNYRMNQAITEGLKYCWGRNGRGRLPLGRRWGEGLKDKILKGTFFYCDDCMIYMLEPEVIDVFKGKEDIKLNEFLKKHPVRTGSSVTMWEDLKPIKEGSDLIDIKYSPKEDLHIMFVRANPNELKKWLVIALTPLPGISYEDVPRPIDVVMVIRATEYDSLKCYNT